MDWYLDHANKKEKRVVESLTSVPIDVHVRTAKEKLEKEKEELPDLYSKINEYELIIQQNEGKRYLLKQSHQLSKEIDKLKKKIKRLENNEHIIEYEQKTLPYLEAYLKSSNQGDNEPKRRNTSLPGEKRFEKIENPVNNLSQSNVVAEYLTDIHNGPARMDIEKNDTCPLCNQNMLLIPTKSIISCTKCGYAATYLDATTSSISYGDEVEFASFSYKRINHFNEWLQQVQAKESMEIPQNIIDAVMNELYRQRITDINEINPKKIREILKILKFRKTYEHVQQICSRITGKVAPKMSPETEEMCRLMFIAVQSPFEKHCPPDRKNFLSYSYCLYKFLQLLGCDNFLDNFTLLKGRDKLMKQDVIFEKICQELQWEYIPSV